MSEMRDCPFCGGPPDVLEGAGDWLHARCQCCLARGPMGSDALEMREGWNRRVATGEDARRWKWFRDEATAEQCDAIHRCLTSVEMDEIADACIRERDPRFTITDAGRAALTDESK